MYLPGAAAFSEKDKHTISLLGLTAEDYNTPDMNVEVWPDNWGYVKMFDAIGSQWRSGFSGPTGLDYAGVRAVLGAKFRFGTDTYEAIRLMEAEALVVMHENG